MNTNLIAMVVMVLSTNWCTDVLVGPPDCWPPHVIQVGRQETNVMAVLPWQGTNITVALETIPGPVVGRRRVVPLRGTNVLITPEP